MLDAHMYTHDDGDHDDDKDDDDGGVDDDDDDDDDEDDDDDGDDDGDGGGGDGDDGGADGDAAFFFTGKGCANMFLKSTVCDLYISWPTERSNYCEAPLDGVQFH